MPRLLKNIEAEICNTNEGTINLSMVSGYVDVEDYIKIYGLTGYLQNFLRVSQSEEFPLNKTFGLVHKNKDIIELNIDY